MISSFYLQIIPDSAKVIKNLSVESINLSASNYWLWISIIEFIGIIFFIYFFKKNKILINTLKNKINVFEKDLEFIPTIQKPIDLLEESKAMEIDFSALMNNINKSKVLYDDLIKKYHPDRFLDFEKNKIATELSKEIGMNRTNYAKLNELRTKAETLFK